MLKNSCKMPVRYFVRVFATIGILLLAVSCKKEDTTDFVKQAEIAAHYAKAEDNMADFFVLFHKALHDTTLINSGAANIDSASVEYIVNSGPAYAAIVFNYGSDGKNCPDGKFRKGEITAVLSGSFDLPEAIFVADFQNFTIDSLEFTGQFSYKNTGLIEAGQYKFEIAFDVSIYSKLIKILSISAQRNVFWKSGFDKPHNTVNHVFRMPGGATALYYGYEGSTTPLVTIEAIFTEDWMIRFMCFHPISQGTFKVGLNDFKTEIFLTGEFIDVYGDNCSGKIFFKNSDNTFGYPLYL
jgi:hypothetical protein